MSKMNFKCAVCGKQAIKATYWCSEHGDASIWVGVANGAGYTVLSLGRTEEDAQNSLYREWRQIVVPGFMPEVTDYTSLKNEFGECAVNRLEIGKAVIWEQEG